MSWQSIASAPRDGTRILVIEGNDANEVPTVAEWYDPASDGYEGEPCWVPSEDVLADMTDEIRPTAWAPIPQIRIVGEAV